MERYGAGDFLASALLFSAILAHEPLHADALRLRGLALVRAGRSLEALADLRTARRLAPMNPLASLHYGIGWLEAGRPARAAALFRRAAKMAPDIAAPWINFASALLALNQPKAARAAARRAVKLAPGDAAAHNAFGLAAMAADDLDTAQRAFTEAIRLARSYQDAWLNLVLTLVRRGKIGFAFQAIEQGLAACAAPTRSTPPRPGCLS
jgi:tetratricopeptide (TPR) repeat protein